MTGRAGPAKKAAVTDAERHCGSWLGVGHDEREQTLNQMLVETEGFDTSMKIIVSAATNRPDILDPALLRVSRFDRRVVLDPPDSNGRKAILEVHASEKSLDSEVDLETKQTPGFSGAHLASLVNEVALFAAMRNKKKIGLEGGCQTSILFPPWLHRRE